ncbi:hypothetical protein K9M79_04770 [Candidatus Woesearchaeota archaeon]|nr:hypothetical protein [Candidatus Woesearchaeota archaeon]
MDYTNYIERRKLIEVMKQVNGEKIPLFEEKLIEKLQPQHKHIYRRLQNYAFNDGSWYRPAHNFVVTSTMVAICRTEGLDERNLIPTAMLHDIGNSLIKILEGKGADWENVDKRIAHRIVGSELAWEILKDLRKEGKIDLQDDEIQVMDDLIMTHDDPYLGIPLETLLEKQHRDADRAFVPSISSWYKDFLNYLDDTKNDYKKTLTPIKFMKQRLAFFYNVPKDNPLQASSALDLSLTKYNEGGSCEPQFTQTGKQIVDHMFKQRSLELFSGVFELPVRQFKRFYSEGLDKEKQYFLSLIDKANHPKDF